ncbi:MAG: hypothetical protein KBD23_01425 [Gammaproteobacteria bacterium]|nr:hypothetical protein [Gammaproteobacteria bacterium]
MNAGLKTKIDTETRLFERLSEKGIDYFSLTLFKGDQPIISHCNHPQWLSLYNLEYHQPGLPPPVQKYILSSKLRVLTWDFSEIDKEARDFIQKRNEVVETTKNISVIFQKQEHLTVVTLASKKKKSHLIDFLNNDLESLLCIEKNLLL